MKLDINGVTINCEVAGQGAPLLLLHGWGGRAGSMQPIANGLLDLRTIYNVDFPGFGESQPPPEPWSVTEYTECIIAFMSKAGIERADIVAHSFGGRVTLLLASTHPELAGRIVITGGAGLKPRRGMGYYRRVYTYKLGKKMLQHGWMVSLAKSLGIDLQKQAASAGSKDYQSLSGLMRQTFVRVVNQDLRYCLPDIRSSTLLIWGENDADAPLWMGKIMEQEIKDAGLVVFEGRGHFAYLEELPRFMKIVRTFLGGLDGSS
jgi:pimeloyl-ACP methyl ester carboxylesterase